MREILFRGKAVNRKKGSHRTSYKNGDWVYGLLTRLYDERFESLPAEMANTDGVNGIDVDYKTIGQFTGLTDNNGKKIFEGDIVKTKYGRLCVVVWFSSQVCSCWDLQTICTVENCVHTKYPDVIDIFKKENLEVIGNIYDNPELLKGGAE